jgi:hypothetical protein
MKGAEKWMGSSALRHDKILTTKRFFDRTCQLDYEKHDLNFIKISWTSFFHY